MTYNFWIDIENSDHSVVCKRRTIHILNTMALFCTIRKRREEKKRIWVSQDPAMGGSNLLLFLKKALPIQCTGYLIAKSKK